MKTKRELTSQAISEIVCGVIVTLVQWIMVILFEGKITNIVLNRLLAAVIAIVVAVMCGTLVEKWAINASTKSLKMRQKYYKIARYEGYWIERMDKSGDYAICALEYDPERHDYMYRGRFYQKSGEIVEFKSNNVIYDNPYIYYISEGTDIMVNGKLIRNVQCCGRMKIHKDNFLVGRFNDLYEGGIELSFKMRKIDEALLADFNRGVNKEVGNETIDSPHCLEPKQTAETFITWFDKHYDKYM